MILGEYGGYDKLKIIVLNTNLFTIFLILSNFFLIH